MVFAHMMHPTGMAPLGVLEVDDDIALAAMEAAHHGGSAVQNAINCVQVGGVLCAALKQASVMVATCMQLLQVSCFVAKHCNTGLC
jgi:hypothetical protein